MIPDLVPNVVVETVGDGFVSGVVAVLWAVGALAGLTTVVVPWAAGGVLLHRAGRRVLASRAGWWLRTYPTVRRRRRRRRES